MSELPHTSRSSRPKVSHPSNTTGLVSALRKVSTLNAPAKASGDPLRQCLHELAEALQAASNYLEASLARAGQDGGNQIAEPVLVENAAEQLDRAREQFRRLHVHLVQE
jgi:hypothetical protein